MLGAAFSYGRQVYNNYQEHGWSSDTFANVNGADILATAAVGAVAGGLIGSGVGAGSAMALLSQGAAAIATGAGQGMAVSAVAYSLAAGDDYTTSGMLTNSAIGAVAGGLSGGVANKYDSLLTRPSAVNSGAWFNKALWNGGINAGSNILQVYLAGERDGDDLVGVGFAGGAVGSLVDVLTNAAAGNNAKFLGPAIQQTFRTLTGEYIMNEATDCDRKSDFDIC